MELYRTLTKEEAAIINKYVKTFEEVKISEAAMYAGKLYREVIFKKKFGKAVSYMYLDGYNNIVQDKITVLRLGRIFFFMDCYLNSEPGSIIYALQSKEDVVKDKDDFKLAKEALDLVGKHPEKYKITAHDINEVKKNLTKVIDMRLETNKKLEAFKSSVDREMDNNEYFNEEIIEKCMPQYKDVMLLNYEKVKLIASKNNCYGALKGAAEKLRRSYNLRMVTGHTEQLSKLQYTMGYFQNLITSYGSIPNMSSNQYLKSIENAGKVNAEFKIENLRQ